MKPRNKFEKAVFAESKNLRQITKTQCKWAFRVYRPFRLPLAQRSHNVYGLWA